MPIFTAFTLSGPIIGATGYFFDYPIIFWIGVALSLVNLFLNIASGAMRFPVMPIAVMGGCAIVGSSWLEGAGLGILAWTLYEGVQEIFPGEGGLLLGGRTSYKSVVDGIARRALSFDLMQAPGLDRGYMYNALEGTAATLFLIQRSLLALNPAHFETARDRLTSCFFSALDQDYSKEEMQSFVLPLLEKRHLEYEAILDGAEDAGNRVRSLGRTMIRNFIEENSIEETQADLATLFIVENLMTEPGRQIKEFEGSGGNRS